MSKQNLMLYPPEVAADFISKQEGFSGLAYKCPAGVWTVGYGHTKGVREGDALTYIEGYRLLEKDLIQTQEELAVLVKVPVTENQFIALMSFVFNFGLTKCRNYTLFKYINAEDEVNTRLWWVKYCNPDNPRITKGLRARRERELALFFEDNV